MGKRHEFQVAMVASPDSLDLESHQQLDELDRACLGDRVYPKVGGYWWLVFAKDQPVAYAGAVLFPEYDAVFLCRAGVLDGFRGHGLQRRLIRVRERLARKVGAKWCKTYTSFDNIHSANNLISCGYRMYRPPFIWGLSNGCYWFRSMEG